MSNHLDDWEDRLRVLRRSIFDSTCELLLLEAAVYVERTDYDRGTSAMLIAAAALYRGLGRGGLITSRDCKTLEEQAADYLYEGGQLVREGLDGDYLYRVAALI